MLGTGARREPNQGYIKTGSGVSYFGAFSLILALLLCLCVNSWADCQTGSWSFDNGTKFVCNEDCSDAVIECLAVKYDAYTYRYNYYSGGLPGYMRSCNSYGPNTSCSSGFQYFGVAACDYTIRCTTQAEADSVSNELNKKDSVIVCINDWSGDPLNGQPIQQQMFLLKCEEGYTKPEDCELLMQVPGTCAQNGYEAGEQPKDSTDNTADCFATFQGDCYMMDKATGNTFTCPCENNSCRAALQDVADGTCINPYAPKSSASSSPSSSVSSSPSSSDSSPSSSEIPHDTIPAQKVDSSGDWEYDYSGILNAINNNIIDVDNNMNSNFFDIKSQLQAYYDEANARAAAQLEAENNIRANTQQIASNTDYTNTLINQSVVPAINSAKNGISNTIKDENAKLIQKYENMIHEVQFIGDSVNSAKNGISNTIKDENAKLLQTLNSSADVGTLPDTAFSIDYDTLSVDTVSLPNIDSLVSMNQAWLDSFQQAIDSITDSTRHDTIGLMEIYDFSDSNEIRQKFSNFFFPGGASNGCPVLDHTIHWPEPIGDQRWYINFGNLLGKFDICAFTRWVVRLFTTIAIIFGSFKAVMRAFGGGSDE